VAGRSLAGSGSQLRDSLNTDVQVFQLLSDDILRHTRTQVLHQKSRTAFLWEGEGVETRTVFPFKGPQCSDRGSELVGGLWDDN
jgi:hypothetical protein